MHRPTCQNQGSVDWPATSLKATKGSRVGLEDQILEYAKAG